MLKRLYNHLTATARIDPRNYAAQVSPSRAASFGYALRGWLYMLRRQKNTRIMMVASVLALALALWVQLPAVEFALIVVVITIIWLTEFINAGIEAAIDVASPEIHPMAQVGKDVASAAVLLGVVASLIVALLLLAPPLLRKIGLG